MPPNNEFVKNAEPFKCLRSTFAMRQLNWHPEEKTINPYSGTKRVVGPVEAGKKYPHILIHLEVTKMLALCWSREAIAKASLLRHTATQCLFKNLQWYHLPLLYQTPLTIRKFFLVFSPNLWKPNNRIRKCDKMSDFIDLFKQHLYWVNLRCQRECRLLNCPEPFQSSISVALSPKHQSWQVCTDKQDRQHRPRQTTQTMASAPTNFLK